MTLKHRLGRIIIPLLPLSRFGFDVLRLELASWWVRLANRIFPTRWLRLRRLRAKRMILANIASGPFLLDGFEHVDLVAHHPSVLAWDCTRSLPFSTQSCRGIRAEHFFEHLDPREQGPRFLSECHRCLEPGGVLRIIVPDCELFLTAYFSEDPEVLHPLGMHPCPADHPTRMDVIAHTFHQGHEHRWAYDFENLKAKLSQAGFVEIEKLAFGHSINSALHQDRVQHQPYSLYVDAVKHASGSGKP